MAKEKVYDGREVLELWCSWGAAASSMRLEEYFLAKRGIRVSYTGPTYAMHRYQFQNPEESYPLYKEWYFEKYPDREQITFDDYVKWLLYKAQTNPNICTRKIELHRFAAKYNLEMDYKIKPDQVIQVTSKGHSLYRKILVVNSVDGEFVDASITYPDDSQSNHLLKMGEFGVVGPIIV